MGIVVYTQVGVFNRCECYTKRGQTGLAVPETPAIKEVLNRRLLRGYLGLALSGIVFQPVVVPFLVHRVYGNAIRVFTQRDDGLSTWSGLGGRGESLQRHQSKDKEFGNVDEVLSLETARTH